MCCAFFWLNAHPQLLLLLAFNRDEFLGRPTEPLRVWEDTEIIGGQDRVNKGTWLGLTRSGRFALVTNFREVRWAASYFNASECLGVWRLQHALTHVYGMPQPHFDAVHDALSRGALPTAFLAGDKSPEEFCADLDLQVRRLVSPCTAFCGMLPVRPVLQSAAV
jgi:uncharacterized protein with NRDE domain